MVIVINYRLTIIFILIHLLFASVSAQKKVHVYGNAPSYSGEKITFLIKYNPVINIDSVVGECIIDEEGDFLCNINVKNSRKIIVPLGQFKGYFYGIPGEKYRLSFPPLKKKTYIHEINPFFKEKIIHLSVVNEDNKGLNNLIRTFDNRFYPALNEAAVKAYTHRKTENKSLADTLDKINVNCSIPFYNNYKRYNLELLKIVSEGNSSKQKEMISGGLLPLNYNNPACLELIDQIFNNYFSKLARTEKGKNIYSSVNREKSYSLLLEIVKSDIRYPNDSLAEFIILKNITREFSQDNFSKEGLLEILDSMSADSDIDVHKIYAKQIKENLTRLLRGFPAPDFELENKQGDPVILKNFRGKYVYLGFCSTYSYPCMQQFRILNELMKKYEENLEIIIVMADDDAAKVENFSQNYGFDGTVLTVGKRKGIFEKYKIKAYPTYYLIDRDGDLLLSPSPTPAENFESIFKNILKEKN